MAIAMFASIYGENKINSLSSTNLRNGIIFFLIFFFVYTLINFSTLFLKRNKNNAKEVF